MIPHPPKPAWGGPQAGITQSLLIRFCECPFRFYLYAYCGLKEALPDNLNLIWGNIMHKGLEHLLRGDSFQSSIDAMSNYITSHYPSCPSTFQHTTREMLFLYPYIPILQKYGAGVTEGKFAHEMTLSNYSIRPIYKSSDRVQYHFSRNQERPDYFEEIHRNILFRGKSDFLNPNILIDHKCKGRIYPLETQQEICHDLQMNLYGYITESENWLYDLIQIPEEAYRCPDRRNGESPEAYAHRLFHIHKDVLNGFPIKQQPNRWICQIPHHQPMQRIHKYFQQTISPLVHRLCLWWEHVTHPDFDPNNPIWYNHIFYQSPVRMFDASRTNIYKCNFHSILTDQSTYDSLVPVDNFYSELTDE